MSLRSAWEEQAEAWLQWVRSPDHDQFFTRLGLPAFLEMLPPPGGQTVDIGCGEGRLSRILRDRGYRVVGVDGSPTLAGHAASHGEPVPVLVADAAALPIKAKSADLVVAYMVLQDLDDMEGAVREAARVLRGGGRFCAAFVHPMHSAAQIDGQEGQDGQGESQDESQQQVSFPHEYFAPRRIVESVERDGKRMEFHSEHRPIERYMRAFEDAGLLIETIREPKPTAEMLTAHPAREVYLRVPWALFVRGIRSLWASS